MVDDMELTISKGNGEGIGFAREVSKIDMDIGNKNDFELDLKIGQWDEEKFMIGNRVYIPGTEYGGLLEEKEVNTKTRSIALRGYTWRGLLTQKVVQPPTEEEHLILNGELNEILKELIGERFGMLFVVDTIDSGVRIANWKVDRYVTLYDAIIKLLTANGHNLKLEYIESETGNGAVHIRAEPVKDYSDELEYSQDNRVNFTVKEKRNGTNHLVCVGKGQNEERIVVELFVQKDGSIGKTQYYTGIEEREAVYDFSSAELEKLEEDGTKRLKELQSYKQTKIYVDDISLELGDIIGGYEEITDTHVQKPITGKILRISGGTVSVEYKIEGGE